MITLRGVSFLYLASFDCTHESSRLDPISSYVRYPTKLCHGNANRALTSDVEIGRGLGLVNSATTGQKRFLGQIERQKP